LSEALSKLKKENEELVQENLKLADRANELWLCGRTMG
jgi:hypothetical protein